jgi:hypothetical protein
MDANEFVFRSVVAILAIFVLVSIQQELESISDSLKILASPPQIEERF